jgi:hypothetical protein
MGTQRKTTIKKALGPEVSGEKLTPLFFFERCLLIDPPALAIIRDGGKEGGMSLEKFIEDQISKAMARGEFDNLPGKGKPLDLDWYFSVPEDLRLGYSVLKNNRVIPQEAELLKEVEELKRQLDLCEGEEDRRRIKKTINEKIMSFQMLIERQRLRK